MPANLDYSLYFNIAFFSILGLGLFFGFLKGLKKSIWGFFVTLIFFAVFFLTIDIAVNLIWTVNLPFLGGLLGNVFPELLPVTQLQEALPILLEKFLGESLQSTLSNENFLELVTAIALFAIKLVYTIVYFTVIQIVYRLIMWILRMIILPTGSKDKKYRSKNRGLGALFGLMTGVLSLYVTLIIFGGMISISESMLAVIPAPEVQTLSYIEFRDGFQSPTTPVRRLSALPNPLENPQFEEAFNMLNDMVTAYNENIVVQVQNQITMTSEYTEEEIPLNLYLFDSVLSMDYQEQQIALREELGIYANVIGDVLNSDYMSSNNLSDITGDEIRTVFTDLSKSNLFTTLIPIAIEVGVDFLDTELTIETDELYAIDWGVEIMQLGEIAATAFDIVNAAGVFNNELDLNTVTIDGDEVEQLFIELGQSEMITLAAYTAIEPVLESYGGEVSAFITIPENIDWSDEFAAIGAVAGEILNTGLTVGDIDAGDPMALLSSLSEIDFTVLLGSQIVTNALINILSGNTSIVIPYLTIPDGLVWLDLLDNDGNITENGELRNILLAINALVSQADNFDLNNINLNFIADLDVEAINSLFESRILVSTITQFIRELALPDSFTLIMPDSVFDENGDLLKLELQNIVEAVHMVLSELACPEDDDVCLELGFDMNGILGLSAENIDILLVSDILSATVGNLVLDMGGEILTVPGSAKTTIYVDEVAMDVVSRDEIKNAFLAISTLGITNIENVTFDISILTNLGLESDPTTLDPDKADTLFASKVLNATLSSYLLDYALADDAFVVVPYEDQDENAVRVIDSIDGTEYISEVELTNILSAVLAIDIQDINNLETLDLNMILDNVSILLDSAILHATISKQLLDLTDVVTVPTNDTLGDPLRITTGPVGFETEFIVKTELENAFDALSVLGITDINNVAIDVSILTNLATEADSTVLDQAKADRLFSSTIINATLSSYIIDFTEGDAALVVVPYEDELGSAVRIIDSEDGTQIIVQTELTNILKAILALDIQDFNNIETLDLGLILDNISVLLDSSIMHATVSKQLLDLTDVVTVPGSVIIETGDVGFETQFIAKAELQATFDSLNVLGITDINNVTMDISILNNVATDDDPTVLDQAKADVLFASLIINATISSYIIDFTEGDSALVVVPYNDESDSVVRTVDLVDGTEIITEVELSNILKAILALDIQDFNNIDTLSLSTLIDNIDVLLDSSIMHATVSKQLIDLGADVIIIPSNDQFGDPLRITTGPVDNETVFIAKVELQATFDALTVLGITDINNVTIDTTILTNLATDDDSTVLDQDKADILFASTIINATLSKYIIDFTEGDSALVVVPYESEVGTTIRLVDAVDGTEFITQAELTNILKAILVLDIQDFNAIDTLDLNLIIENKETLLDSVIMHATISKQIFDLGSDVISVPYVQEDDLTLIRVTSGDPGSETEFITRLELEAVFDSLGVLGITDLNSFSGTVDLALLSDPVKVDTLLSSSVIQATISQQLIDLDDGATIIVPFLAEDNSTQIRITVGEVGFTSEYVIKDELKAIFDALDVLGITDVESFGGNDDLDLSLLAEGTNADVVLASSMIQAIISKQVLDLDDVSATIIVPYVADDGLTDIRVEVGALTTLTNYINKIELKALILSLDVLGLTDVSTFGGSVNLDLLSDEATINQVLSSSILQATISDQIIVLGEDDTLEVPYLTEDTLTTLRVTTGPIGFETEYLITNEIKAIIDALDVLGINDVTTFGGTVDLSLLSDPVAKSTVLASSVIQATISKQLLDTEDGITFIIPYFEEDGITEVVIEVGGVGQETEYISSVELSDLLTALDVLGLTDVTSFDSSSVDFSTFAQGTNAQIMLESAIIQAIVSKQVLDLDASSTITVPYFADNDVTALRITVGPLSHETELVIKSELEATIIALDILGVTDPSAYSGTVDISLFYELNSRNTLLASSIMQATISKQVLDLGAAIITVPVIADDGITEVRRLVGGVGEQTDYILKPEIHALFEALELLNITDITTFDGTVSLDKFMASLDLQYDDNQNTLLASSTMQATITKQITDLGPTVLLVPNTDCLGTAIQVTVSSTLYLYKAEIKSLINALDILGVNDITTFDGTVGLTSLFASQTVDYDTNQNIMLSSASMHATITQQINDLGSAVLVVPDTDVNSVAVKISESGTNFIVKTEIKALINAMDILGVNNIATFDGTIGLTALFASTNPATYDANQDTLLASASMHATITQQIDDLGSAVLLVPNTDVSGTSIQATVALTHFIMKAELKSMFNAMDVLGITDITAFDGTINLASLTLEADQDTVLASASMHATISQTLYDLPSAVLIIPIYNQNGEIEANRVQKNVSSTDFIYKSEIKALINAFIDMGYTDLSNFGSSIDSSKFFSNPDLYLLSASIHATLSDKLLNDTGGSLIIPDININNATTLRIIQTDVTYIEINETKALLDALDAMGLTDFSSISITTTAIFGADFDVLLTSASMQATISSNILSGALDDSAAAGSGKLVIPNYFREAIAVATVADEWIEKVELKALLNSLDTLGITDFSGSVDGSAVSGMNDAQLDTLLASGSMQVSIDNMLKGNPNINTKIPDLALEDVYGMTDITTKVEIKAFIKATQQLGAGDITNVTFSAVLIAALTPAERDIALDSMIVRNMLTDELETMMLADDPVDLYWPANGDYELSDSLLFLTEAGINLVLTHYGMI